MDVNSVGALDGISLLFATVSAVGNGSSIPTAGFASLSIAVTGNEACQLQILGSNDQVSWFPLQFVQADTHDLIDTINTSGIYSLRVTTSYIQYSCSLLVGSLSLSVVGRAADGLNAADKLSQALNEESAVRMQVAIRDGLKRDPDNAIVPSDCFGPITIGGPIGAVQIIDTKGYNTIVVQSSTTLAAAYSVSNDGVNFAGTVASGPTGSLQTAGQLAAGQVQAIACMGRLFKISTTTSGVGVAYLRTANMVGVQPINLATVGGSTVQNAGLAGTLPVAGTAANGVAPTSNPLLVAGIDSSSLTRRVLVDTSGRLQAALPQSVLSANNLHGITAPLAVQDITTLEGKRVIDLLGEILRELKILNQFTFESKFNLLTPNDDPELYRQDESFASLN